MTKRKIKENVDSLSIEYESAENVLETITKLISTYGADNVSFEKLTYDYSDDKYIAVLVERDETDEEEERRLTLEAQAQIQREKYARLQYEELKKKFG